MCGGEDKSEQWMDLRSKLGKEGVVSTPWGQIRNWDPETQAGPVRRTLRENIYVTIIYIIIKIIYTFFYVIKYIIII